MLSVADELILRELDACLAQIRALEDAEMTCARLLLAREDRIAFEKHRHAAIMLGTIREKIQMRREGRFEPNVVD